MMRSVRSSHWRTWTSLIIVVRLHAFKTAAQFLSALVEKFRSKLTVWKEEQFTVLPGQGIKQRDVRVPEWVTKTLPLVKPGVWGFVQTRAQSSTEEDAHVRPGHP